MIMNMEANKRYEISVVVNGKTIIIKIQRPSLEYIDKYFEGDRKEQLKKLIADMSIPVRDVLRQKGTPFEELDLGNEKWSDEELFDFMMAHPILINRPIVVTSLGTKLCRPSEVVLDILVEPQRGAFIKEDGEVVINEKGQRV